MSSPKLDYPTFIEKLNALDTDQDHALTKNQFLTLLAEMDLSNDDNYGEIIFNGISGNGRTAYFTDIKTFYDCSFYDLNNKTMATVLFKGIDSDRDNYINNEQFQTLADYINLNKTQEEREALFQSIQNDNHLANFKDVSYTLFGVNFPKDFNPQTARITSYSPHSACCLLL